MLNKWIPRVNGGQSDIVIAWERVYHEDVAGITGPAQYDEDVSQPSQDAVAKYLYSLKKQLEYAAYIRINKWRQLPQPTPILWIIYRGPNQENFVRCCQGHRTKCIFDNLHSSGCCCCRSKLILTRLVQIMVQK